MICCRSQCLVRMENIFSLIFFMEGLRLIKFSDECKMRKTVVQQKIVDVFFFFISLNHPSVSQIVMLCCIISLCA